MDGLTVKEQRVRGSYNAVVLPTPGSWSCVWRHAKWSNIVYAHWSIAGERQGLPEPSSSV